MRTLQISETVTTLKVDFPVDAQVRPFMSPTRMRDPVSLSSNRKHTLDIATSPQRSDFRVLDAMQTHATYHAHAQPPVAQSSDHAVPDKIVEPRVVAHPSDKKAVAKKALNANERDRETYSIGWR